MKHLLIILAVVTSIQSFSQTAPLKYWVQFADKNNSEFTISAPEDFLSATAISRRAKFNIAITTQDLPVNATYIQQVNAIEGVSIVHASKWFNAITVELLDSSFMNTALPQIEALTAVNDIRSVEQYTDYSKEVVSRTSQEIPQSIVNEYGVSYRQLEIHNGHLLHELDYKGEGVKIGVFDSGFYGVHFLKAFSELRDNNRLKLTKDIVDADNNVYNGGNHGKSVLSIMTAFIPDTLIGSAPEADYYLFRTEDGSSEFVVEEDNWVRAMEMADSIGIQIVNSSLGYTTFNDPDQDHTYADMDGNTTRISRAADIAASKGILVVNSAGNSGDDPWGHIGAPADADSILAVGAVSPLGDYAWFSSRGPSADGDVKPNVCGVGNQTVYANLSEGVSTGNGTSFSAPIISGLAACLWQAFPNKSNMEIRDAIQRSANRYDNPNNTLGYGIPDFIKAFELLSATANGIEETGVLIYPNPFIDHVNVILEAGEYDEIVMYSNDGREALRISELAIGDETSAVRLDSEIASLSAGRYLFTLLLKNEVVLSSSLVKTVR